MNKQKKTNQQRKRRSQRARFRQASSRATKPRVTVFRSLTNIYAQIVEDSTGKTLLSGSSLNLKSASGDKKAIARAVGLELGKRAVEQSVDQIFFDRGAYRYHGRIKALADGLRESGLKF